MSLLKINFESQYLSNNHQVYVEHDAGSLLPFRGEI